MTSTSFEPSGKCDFTSRSEGSTSKIFQSLSAYILLEFSPKYHFPFPFLKTFFRYGHNVKKIYIPNKCSKTKLLWKKKHSLWVEVWLKNDLAIQSKTYNLRPKPTWICKRLMVCLFLNWTLHSTGRAGVGERGALGDYVEPRSCDLQSTHRDSTASGFVVCASAVGVNDEEKYRFLHLRRC